jgi:predicted esterase
MAKVNPLSEVQDNPDYLLAASRDQVAKLSELIHDASKYRRALRSFGYDIYPDGGEISTDETDAMMTWLSRATRNALEKALAERGASVT